MNQKLSSCQQTDQSNPMKYTSMTKSQKEAICAEAESRKARKENTTCASLARWAKLKFDLPTVPGRSTLSRILKKYNSLPRHSNVIRSSNLTRARNGKSHAVETAVFAWICDQYKRRIHVNSRQIQEKANCLQQIANNHHSPQERLTLSFSDGWLNRFKKRWGLLVTRPSESASGPNVSTADSALNSIRIKLRNYAKQDIFNAVESALNYKMAPDKTVPPDVLPDTQGAREDRITLLFCCNADGSEKMELMVIGSVYNPRSFGRQTGQDLGFNYHANPNAWMTSSLFFDWLLRFDARIGRTPGRHVALLIDSCSAHGTAETVPSLDNIDIIFMPPNTTTNEQPCNAGIISTVKIRYRSFQLDRALDLVDESARDIYKVEVLTAMRAVKRIWNELPSSVIADSWRVSKFLPGDESARTPVAPTGAEVADRTYLQDRVHELVPVLNRIPIDSFFHSKEEDDCIQRISDEGLIQHIVEENSHAYNKQEDVASETPLPSLQEQLKALALAKRIAVVHHADEACLASLRRLQNTLRQLKADTTLCNPPSELPASASAEPPTSADSPDSQHPPARQDTSLPRSLAHQSSPPLAHHFVAQRNSPRRSNGLHPTPTPQPPAVHPPPSVPHPVPMTQPIPVVTDVPQPMDIARPISAEGMGSHLQALVDTCVDSRVQQQDVAHESSQGASQDFVHGGAQAASHDTPSQELGQDGPSNGTHIHNYDHGGIDSDIGTRCR